MHRRTYQEDGAGVFPFAHDESLTVVDASITSGRISTFKLALQESVRRNASGADAFAVSVEQSGIGDFIGGRYEVFEQGAEFRGLDIFLAEIAAAGNLDGRGQVGEHDAERVLVLREIVGQ